MTMIPAQREAGVWGLTLEHADNEEPDTLLTVGPTEDGGLWIDAHDRPIFLTLDDAAHLLTAIGAALRGERVDA
jgi:hypothetical protein